MTTVTPLRRDDGPLVLPAAIVAGATMHTDDAKHATPVHNASTGETIGRQEHASAAQPPCAPRMAHSARGARPDPITPPDRQRSAQQQLWPADFHNGSHPEKLALSITSLLYPEQPT